LTDIHVSHPLLNLPGLKLIDDVLTHLATLSSVLGVPVALNQGLCKYVICQAGRCSLSPLNHNYLHDASNEDDPTAGMLLLPTLTVNPSIGTRALVAESMMQIASTFTYISFECIYTKWIAPHRLH